MPRGVYQRKHPTAARIKTFPPPAVQQVRAAMSRWERVEQERQQFMEPFLKLPIEEAMAYLESLRGIIEDGGHILNDRIGSDKNKMRCAGPRCGKDLSGLRPNGMPLWIAKKDIRDPNYPDIIRSLYFCSELCNNDFARKHMGAFGGTGQ